MSAYVQAFLVADSVTRDAATQQHTVSGIRRGVLVESVPTRLGVIHCYIAFTDAEGVASGAFEILDPDLRRRAYVKCNTLARSVQRDDVVEYTAWFSGLLMEKAGAYTVQFLLNGKVLAVTRLDVILPIRSGG